MNTYMYIDQHLRANTHAYLYSIYTSVHIYMHKYTYTLYVCIYLFLSLSLSLSRSHFLSLFLSFSLSFSHLCWSLRKKVSVKSALPRCMCVLKRNKSTNLLIQSTQTYQWNRFAKVCARKNHTNTYIAKESMGVISSAKVYVRVKERQINKHLKYKAHERVSGTDLPKSVC